MQWFFGYSGNSAGWFRDMIKVAVLSAKAKTDLEPHCLYDGEGDEVSEWLEANDVIVHRAEVPFRKELFSDSVIERNKGTPYSPYNASGHFLRYIVPDFANGDYALYTDCDIMFMENILDVKSDIFGAVGELNQEGISSNSSFNSGVMFINVKEFLKERENLIDYTRSEGFYNREYHSYDQVILNRYFSNKWNSLDQEYNWRPWQGINKNAKIIHFHGPKPHRIQEILNGNNLKDESQLLKYIDLDRNSYNFYCETFYDYLRYKYN